MVMIDLWAGKKKEKTRPKTSLLSLFITEKDFMRPFCAREAFK
jgi:hypothetical protein